MASAGIRCGWNCNFLDHCSGNIQGRPSNGNAPACHLMIHNHADRSRHRRGAISAAMPTVATAVEKGDLKRSTSLESVVDGVNSKEAAVAYEKLDEWMSESVTEIVKNLRKAPLLVHVYKKNKRDGDDGTPRMVMEKAVGEEDWRVTQRKWEAGEAPKPEGLIFVEELADDSERQEEEYVEADGITRAWGVVVQGRGAECPPACYLLKTSRAAAGGGAGFGLGLGCTHFCLVRVTNFRETVESQLKNCWLLQAQAKAHGL